MNDTPSILAVARRLPLWYRFHDEGTRLDWRQTIRVHWVANVRMFVRVVPTVRFTVVSLIPVALWIGTSAAIARLLPMEADGWTILRDRFLDGLLIGLLPYIVLQHIAFMVAIQATYAPLVREALAEIGIHVCPNCGHRLADATVPRCPECGHHR